MPFPLVLSRSKDLVRWFDKLTTSGLCMTCYFPKEQLVNVLLDEGSYTVDGTLGFGQNVGI